MFLSTPIIIRNVFHDFKCIVFGTRVIGRRGRLIGHVGLGWWDIQVLVHGICVRLFHLLVFVICHILIVYPTDRLANPIIIFLPIPEVPHVQNCCVGSMAGCYTPAALEYNLPDTVDIRKEFTDDSALADIPHLECAIGSTENFEFVMLEAGDCTCMCG
jgi:hypothetical protein